MAVALTVILACFPKLVNEFFLLMLEEQNLNEDTPGKIEFCKVVKMKFDKTGLKCEQSTTTTDVYGKFIGEVRKLKASHTAIAGAGLMTMAFGVQVCLFIVDLVM